MSLGELIKSGDWKGEKHVPVIEAPGSVKVGEAFEVTVAVGKEIAHPNTSEHHIKWLDLYLKYDDSQFLIHLGHLELTPVFSDPKGTFKVKMEKAGTLIALSYCNIHGLWENSHEISVR